MFEKIFSLFDSVSANLSEEDRAKLVVNVAVFGVTGVGKTLTCNVLLGTKWKVGHTEATTSEIWNKTLQIERDGKLVDTNIHITDFPGLGESLDADKKYLPLYLSRIQSFDAILWILSANDRQMAQVQAYCNSFASEYPNFADKLVFGLNKSDLVEPMEWGAGGENLPSNSQEHNIHCRVLDVYKRMNESSSICRVSKERIVAYSSKYKWRIVRLFETLRKAIPRNKTMSLVRFAAPAHWSSRLDKGRHEDSS
jgi:predicted GTPase